MWNDKKVLVTGSQGMIGRELVEQLESLGADVFRFDLAEGYDITCYPDLIRVFQEFSPEFVMNLFGIKGNPKRTQEKPVDFMQPMLIGDTNIITIAQKYGVKKFLYTSSIAVEHPETDKYPAWAKQTAETLIEAMRIQYPKGTEYCIVRPSNVYGRYDNFDTEYPMVITSLIKQALKEESLTLYNRGHDVRDFINARDVARGMIQAMDEMPEKPVNLCSGSGHAIYKVARIICRELNKELILGPKTEPTRRVIERNWDNPLNVSLEEGLKEVIEYAKKM